MDAPGLTRAARPTPTLLRTGLLAALGRLVLAALVLVPVTLAGGPSLLQASVPTMTRVFEALMPHLHVAQMGLASSGKQQKVQMQVVLIRPLAGNGLVIDAGPHRTANASTPARNGLLAPLLAALVAAAWPVHSGSREVLVRVLLFPALLLWCWLDAPLMLASALWQPLADALAPGQFSPLAAAGHFLAGGGRIAAALSLAALVVVLARLLASQDKSTAGHRD